MNGARQIGMFLLGSAVAATACVGPDEGDPSLIEENAEQRGFVNLPLDSVVPGRGHVGVDIWWVGPDGNEYNPCHHADDPFFGACVMSNVGPISYYKVHGFDNANPSAPNDWPFGIFIDDQNLNACADQPWCKGIPPGQPLQHGWAELITGAALEVYGYDGLGGARVHIGPEGWVAANGGVYAPPLGTITLPSPGSPRLNGFVTRGGAPVAADEAGLDFFQDGQLTAATSTGVPLAGFASTSTNGDGYYSSGPMFGGTYKIYVSDRATQSKIIIYADIWLDGERLDFDLAQPCFGFPACEPVPF